MVRASSAIDGLRQDTLQISARYFRKSKREVVDRILVVILRIRAQPWVERVPVTQVGLSYSETCWGLEGVFLQLSPLSLSLTFCSFYMIFSSGQFLNARSNKIS